ncbi:hypothetical protein VHEMI00566 [[Torrubiella] hemipterigena]|uniref:Transmembrane protein 42 n=1 Tax=[Torrubiella] hemipterigena TaxID=1531966 RepID=A0A0A1T2A4_9HYPO|nr:hypothetical protein VHEMI00566 [[Torrubiella] hemipterigena]
MAPRRRKVAQDTPADIKDSSSAESKVSMAASDHQDAPNSGGWSTQAQWLFFAIASGICAACNGAFAKLTTTQLTSTLSKSIASFLNLSEYELYVEYLVRAGFFTLNLVFNGVMWTLFTTALARGTSATQVSIINTSTNFIITAMLGMLIFSEKLPSLWWAGASLLIVGNVIAGRKNDGEEAPANEASYGTIPTDDVDADADGGDAEEEDEDLVDLSNEAEL